jgi:hypothetical protein
MTAVAFMIIVILICVLILSVEAGITMFLGNVILSLLQSPYTVDFWNALTIVCLYHVLHGVVEKKKREE